LSRTCAIATVTSSPGGGQDILARLIGQWLSDRLGQQFIIENRCARVTTGHATALPSPVMNVRRFIE
jgi:hypothetical protein